MDIVNKM